MIKIVVDSFGGDYAPNEIVKGAVMALEQDKEISLILAGKKDVIENLLKENNYDGDRIEIIDADEVIDNHDQPTVAIRQKTNSSLVKAIERLKQDEEVKGLVSAGSTGAVLTGAFLKLGRIKGISRPALCPILPTLKGGVVAIVDVGANMDTKPINLVHFALMGIAYLKTSYGINNPRVALLSVGTEQGKGNELTKEVYNLLSTLEGINFVGNVEGRDLLSGDFDLVVSDGFAGNVLLKSTEGAVKGILTMLKDEISNSFMSKIGYLFMRKTFKKLKSKLDYSNKGGAVFLGAKKLVVKSHGNSKAVSICASIMQVVEMEKTNLISSIESELESVDFEKLFPAVIE